MSESAVVDACIKLLWLKGYYCWRNNSGAYKPEGSKRYIRFGLKGSADIIGLSPTGQFIAIECKYGKNKPTPEQLTFGEQITSHGGIYIVAYSVDDLAHL